jgi:hypothetical protein
MELAFDDRQLLLPGVHEVSMATVKEYFAKFQRSDRRMNLFATLTEFVDAVKKAGCGESVILDGSFVMACVDEPEDIDVVLVLPAGWDDTADLKPYKYNLVSKKSAKRNYGFDLIVVKPGSAREAEWIDYFSGVNVKWRDKFGWPADTRKGILRVMI